MRLRLPGLVASLAALALTAAGLLAIQAAAQIGESAEDPTGVSIPYPLVHLVHAVDRTQPGSTAQLANDDPFLLYQLGRDLLNRQFRLEHGVYGRTGEASVPLYVERAGKLTHGIPARFARDHTASCGFCHSMPYREPGAGQTIGSTGGEGRNTPHFFGAGLIEMLGEQVRVLALERCDANADGIVDRAEAERPCPVRIAPLRGGAEIDFGSTQVDAHGVPQLNPAFRVWYVDATGKTVADAVSLADPRVIGFNLAFQPFGWGRGTRQLDGRRVAEGGEAGTLRAFFTGAADVHMGLQAHDPTQLGIPGNRGRRSLAGALQFDLGGSPDLGLKTSSAGLSLDDPDGDGHLAELTEGDVDAVEFAMLHAPAPAVRATVESEAGRAVLLTVGCQRCHVESWQLEASDAARGLLGDRRLFSLETVSELQPDGRAELVARLVRRDLVLASGRRVPRGAAVRVERVYSDFKQWDIGPAFHERRFDGSLQREHRTTPLWGVGSTAPYGHSGRFDDLDAVITAHGGAAEAEAASYRALPSAERARLLAYLDSLVLFVSDEIPADIDGDGRRAERFEVAGQWVGPERFDARFLFGTAPRYRVLKEAADHRGRLRPLMVIDNVAEAFGLRLALRLDTDQDGFADAVDPVAPPANSTEVAAHASAVQPQGH
jgi:hypothetical protein